MISVLLPTKGRPALAARFLDSLAARTSRLDDLEVVLYVDDDDRESGEIDHPRVSVRRIVGPRRTMGGLNSACLAQAKGDIIILGNDDVVVQTPGWDERVRALHAEFPDGVYLGYPNDLFKRNRVSTFPILSRAACELVGSPYPEAYRGGLIDYHLFDVFQRVGRLGHDRIRYLPDVVFEHTHYRTGKLPLDNTYRSRERFGDDSTFMALRTWRQSQAMRLAAHISGAAVPPLGAPTSDRKPVGGAVGAVAEYARAFLADRALPLGWRTFLFTWYCGRHVGARLGRRPWAS